MKKLFLFIFLAFSIYAEASRLPICNEEQQTITTLYGTFNVSEPIIWDLIKSPAMQRIKLVHQYGISFYVDETVQEYNRFDHCIGVWALLRLYGASLEEQIAGLLHDASHTVFSHTGGFVFHSNEMTSKNSYQDNIHGWYLAEQGVDKILHKYGLSIEDILPKNSLHKALEQELPTLCADRIEYNIQEGLMIGILSIEEIPNLLSSLHFENEKWFFSNAHYAKKLGLVSLHGSEHMWGGPFIYIQNFYAAKALQRAIDIGLITFDEVHFSTDLVVWQKLNTCSDSIICELLSSLKNYKTAFDLGTTEEHHTIAFTKFRGIDPLIKQNEKVFFQLTENDEQYAQLYTETKTRVAAGFPLKAAFVN